MRLDIGLDSYYKSLAIDWNRLGEEGNSLKANHNVVVVGFAFKEFLLTEF